MGNPQSKANFEEGVAPILAQKKSPPSWFKPQVVTQPIANMANVTLAFLSDGTVAGTAKLSVAPQPIAVRGVYYIEEETRLVTTNVDISIEDTVTTSGVDDVKNDDSLKFMVGAFGLLELVRGRPADPEDWKCEFIEDVEQFDRPEKYLPMSSEKSFMFQRKTALPMTKERFDSVCAPLLARSCPPPSWFKIQALRQPLAGLGTILLAFLSDGTLAGTATFNISKFPLALRGIYTIDIETRRVHTEIEVSLEGTIAKESNAMSFMVGAFGLLEIESGRPAAKEDWDCDFIDEKKNGVTHPGDFLPQLVSEHQKKESLTMDSGFGEVLTVQHSTGSNGIEGTVCPPSSFAGPSSQAMTAAINAMNADSSSNNNNNNNQEQQTSAASENTSQQQQQQVTIPKLPTSIINLGNNKSNNVSPFRSPRSGRPYRAGLPRRLFDRLGGTYQIPTDQASLKKLFESYDESGDGYISREEFVNQYKDFESDMGVEVTDRDINSVFRRFGGRDQKLNFNEFQMFLLHRAKQ